MRTWMLAAALAGMAGAAAAQEPQRQDSEKRKGGSEQEQTQKQPGQQEQAELHAAWYDNWISGVHFRLGPQGRVFLMVPDEETKGEFKTYEADSMQAFRRKHADVVRKHDLETLFGMSERQEEQRQADGQARRFRNQEELRRWVRSQEQALRPELRQWAKEGMERQEPSARRDPQDQADRPGQAEERPGRRERGGPSLGIVVAPVDPSLQRQLRLEEGQGFVVHRVEQDSLAEKAGVRKYDVIAELKGRAVYDFQEFRSDLEDALTAGKPFELGVIRDGERRTVKVQPTGEGREAK